MPEFDYYQIWNIEDLPESEEKKRWTLLVNQGNSILVIPRVTMKSRIAHIVESLLGENLGVCTYFLLRTL